MEFVAAVELVPGQSLGGAGRRIDVRKLPIRGPRRSDWETPVLSPRFNQ